MADTTPISNALNIALADHIGDTLPTAGDNGLIAVQDGTDFAADHRNLALQFAYNELAIRLLNKYGVAGVAQRCEGLITTQAITFATAGSTLNKDFIAPLRLVKSTGATYKQLTKPELVADDYFYLTNAFTIESGVLIGYERTAGTLTALNAGTGTLYYVKSDRKNTTTGATVAVNTAPDTTIDPTWQNFLIEYAAYRLALIKASAEWMEKAPIYKASADAILAP